MEIEKHPYYEYGTFTLKLKFEELIFLQSEDGPKISITNGICHIDTETHNIKIDIDTGKTSVKQTDWTEYFTISNSIFECKTLINLDQPVR